MPSVIFKSLGVVDYKTTFDDMKDRLGKDNLPNEIWLLEHPRIFTLGTAAKKEHILSLHSRYPLFPQALIVPPSVIVEHRLPL